MFSRIGDYLRTGGIAKDPQHQQAVTPDKQHKGNDKPRDEAPVDDDMLFSIDAIRTLLTTQDLPPDAQAELDDILNRLRQLDQQGIKNIPVRLGQSIFEAVRDAVAALGR